MRLSVLLGAGFQAWAGTFALGRRAGAPSGGGSGNSLAEQDAEHGGHGVQRRHAPGGGPLETAPAGRLAATCFQAGMPSPAFSLPNTPNIAAR
jgi:hypothetical protein